MHVQNANALPPLKLLLLELRMLHEIVGETALIISAFLHLSC